MRGPALWRGIAGRHHHQQTQEIDRNRALKACADYASYVRRILPWLSAILKYSSCEEFELVMTHCKLKLVRHV